MDPDHRENALTPAAFADVTWGAPRSITAGKFIAAKPKVFLVVPLLRTFGVDQYEGQGKLSLSMTVTNPVFVEGIHVLDDFLRRAIVANSVAWLKKSTMTLGETEFVYSSLIKPPKDDTLGYASTFKIPLGFKVVNNVPDLTVNPFTHTGVNVGYKLGAYKNHNAGAIMAFNGVTIVGTKVHPSLTLQRLHVEEGEALPVGPDPNAPEW
jgi:hypothetical protein